MIVNKNYTNYNLNLLSNIITKKGKKNISKQLLTEFAINTCKNNSNFSILLETLIKSASTPFNLLEKNKKYKYVYYTQFKSISRFLLAIQKSVTHKKKRISIQFYLKKEFEKFFTTLNTIVKNKVNLLYVCNSVKPAHTHLKKQLTQTKLIKNFKEKECKFTYTTSLNLNRPKIHKLAYYTNKTLPRSKNYTNLCLLPDKILLI